ncbi:MAG: ribosome maturation factor RimP [Spirochaetales bacterium]|nr:ribosome maturation factor RimP [Spirochaetales bacterium]MCF7938840.1 ribosome maturation factor RimP [Spirochaetales bacterium]
MLSNKPHEDLYHQIRPVVERLGFRTVHISSRHSSDGIQVYIVIQKPGGVTIDDCTEVSRTLLPRLEVELDREDIALEVSSPGINRTIKHVDEFFALTGAGLKVLPVDADEWIHGTLEDSDDAGIEILTETDRIRIEYARIRKAQLED